MDNLKTIVEVLGQENSERLKESITDIIINNIETDLNNYNLYLLDPEDVQEFINECKEEAFNRVKEEVINNMIEKIKECI